MLVGCAEVKLLWGVGVKEEKEFEGDSKNGYRGTREDPVHRRSRRSSSCWVRRFGILLKITKKSSEQYLAKDLSFGEYERTDKFHLFAGTGRIKLC